MFLLPFFSRRRPPFPIGWIYTLHVGARIAEKLLGGLGVRSPFRRLCMTGICMRAPLGDVAWFFLLCGYEVLVWSVLRDACIILEPMQRVYAIIVLH